MFKIIIRRIVRIFNYLFKKRLAIKPHCFYHSIIDEIYIYEWQEMPFKYRWF